MFRFLRAVRFLFMGPVILLFLVFVHRMTAPEEGWFGGWIAWVISLVRVVSTLLLAGGVAALVAYFRRPQTPPRP